MFMMQTINVQNSDRRSSSAEAYLTPVENTATNWLTLTGQMVNSFFMALQGSLDLYRSIRSPK